MGILKSIKNFVTGGAAEVSLEFENRILNDSQPLRIKLTATAKDETVIIDKVYVNVAAMEKSANTKKMYADQKFLDDQVQLNAGESKTWDVQFEIPSTAPATFIGKHSSLKWQAKGGLEMSGVDPKSDTELFVVNRAAVYQI